MQGAWGAAACCLAPSGLLQRACEAMHCATTLMQVHSPLLRQQLRSQQHRQYLYQRPRRQHQPQQYPQLCSCPHHGQWSLQPQ